MKHRWWLAVSVAAALWTSSAGAQEKATPPADNLAWKTLRSMVGGRWVSRNKMPDGRPIVELRYTQMGDGVRINGRGRIMNETVQAWFGWDPHRKSVYYLDQHGSDVVYHGFFREDAGKLKLDFKAVVGAESSWISELSLPEPDRYVGVITGLKDGKPTGESHTINLIREADPETDWIYLLKPVREGFEKGATPEESKILQEHVAYLRDLHSRGVVIIGGPSLDLPLQGYVIFRAPNREAAEQIGKNDPAVKSGVFKAEVRAFRTTFGPTG